MSTVGLFAMGVFVTLLVGAALALLVYAAVLDGRDEARSKETEANKQAYPVVGAGRRSVA